MATDQEAIRAVEKVLKEPVAAQFSDQTWRIRTNLIIAATIAVVIGLADIRISPDSTFLGLKFSGLSHDVLRAVLGAVIVYLLVHFLWASWDSLLEWRLRITGTRSAFQTGSFWGSEEADYPVDPRQSTLYNWWVAQQAQIEGLGELVSRVEATCSRWENELKELRAKHPETPASQNLHNALHGLTECREQAAKIARAVEANTKVVISPRITASLGRFDNWFRLFLRSQNLRWLVVEFTGPVAFAGFALWLLFA